MNSAQQLIETELGDLMRADGVRACALVDSASGLVLHNSAHAGPPELDSGLWEAVVEHWRLNLRLNRHFEVLGGLRAVVLHHPQHVLVLLPCSATGDLLVACVATQQSVNWKNWQRRVRELGDKLVHV